MYQHPFLQTIPKVSRFRDVTRSQNFRSLPTNWLVAIMDIKDSTEAIESGHYRDVNIIGASGIIGCFNAAGKKQLPFSFGGDGSAICIPADLAEKVRGVLANIRQIAYRSYHLKLRVALVPVRMVRDAGYDIKITLLKLSELETQPMFTGGGLSYAEELLKEEPLPPPCSIPEGYLSYSADFNGLECRWKAVPSPSDETISLLIHTLSSSDEIYQNILKTIQSIYGEDPSPHPLRERDLKFRYNPVKLMGEIKIRTFGKNALQRISYFLKVILQNLIGEWFMKRQHQTEATDWGLYKSDLVRHADYRKFDDMLRMVIAGTVKQREELTGYLDRLHNEGKIVYGIHASDSSLVTCMVYKYHRNHIHFVDGNDGGYAIAAKQLKKQLKLNK